MSTVKIPALVSSNWLAQHLADDNLRVFDCTVFLGFTPDDGLSARSGHNEYEEAHIPGAAFIDQLNALSNPWGSGPFMMSASSETISQALSVAGLGNDTQVVLYSSTPTVYWATRLWWLLRANGFTNAAVLDGGLPRWIAEGRSVASGIEEYPAATFIAEPDPLRWADKYEVLAEIGSNSVCTINTLSEQEFQGTGAQSAWEKVAYNRPGRITGSKNVPHGNFLTKDGLFAPIDQLAQMFNEIGATKHERIILYCGGGLSSTMAAMALHLNGYDNVAIYDGSMNEWGWDESLPMEMG